jgi:hypothetical protein
MIVGEPSPSATRALEPRGLAQILEGQRTHGRGRPAPASGRTTRPPGSPQWIRHSDDAPFSAATHASNGCRPQPGEIELDDRQSPAALHARASPATQGNGDTIVRGGAGAYTREQGNTLRVINVPPTCSVDAGAGNLQNAFPARATATTAPTTSGLAAVRRDQHAGRLGPTPATELAAPATPASRRSPAAAQAGTRSRLRRDLGPPARGPAEHQRRAAGRPQCLLLGSALTADNVYQLPAVFHPPRSTSRLRRRVRLPLDADDALPAVQTFTYLGRHAVAAEGTASDYAMIDRSRLARRDYGVLMTAPQKNVS